MQIYWNIFFPVLLLRGNLRTDLLEQILPSFLLLRVAAGLYAALLVGCFTGILNLSTLWSRFVSTQALCLSPDAS